jgi:RsiW-degrading membrane proteinase PrsW (M82 family)
VFTVREEINYYISASQVVSGLINLPFFLVILKYVLEFLYVSGITVIYTCSTKKYKQEHTRRNVIKIIGVVIGINVHRILDMFLLRLMTDALQCGICARYA